MVLISVGSFLMRFLVMWIGFYFIVSNYQYTATEFAVFLTASFGGAALQVFTTEMTADTQILFWVYPISLFVGFLIYSLLPGKRELPKLRIV